jgi:hypothetical protein
MRAAVSQPHAPSHLPHTWVLLDGWGRLPGAPRSTRRRKLPVALTQHSSAFLEVGIELGLQLVGGFAPSSPLDCPQAPLRR